VNLSASERSWIFVIQLLVATKGPTLPLDTSELCLKKLADD
jgi:hypothetical protein